MTKNELTSEKYGEIYQKFNSPITALDCGKRCGPHNVGGKPFCCDICHSVPTAYDNEWKYLQPKTDLWRPWNAETCEESVKEAQEEFDSLREETPDNMILLECLGPDDCQREFRTLICRQFPFFPYVDSNGVFIGLSYYSEYEETCWVISNLQVVTDQYRQEFIQTYDKLFPLMSRELNAYQYHSEHMREKFSKENRKIPLLHRNGENYLIDPQSEALEKINLESTRKFGPYKIMAEMPFPDEIE
ncbi:MAG: hypothetical protein HON98_04800 [Chloroflexi bacterium]|nr:hypothetical protein [Chloroflexota bacterium]MBT3671142.1 hypothetical protein [Chloroflexota bacterium]MBT4004073.1 hypothetical protein [Chloroflexota bacterium]MBT4304399.1 hypothetical protein [Chloroflexota bacterium]MBT4534418.1 hypothetical protein [Chloroflexota bacterium]